jgi:hypothetical protein
LRNTIPAIGDRSLARRVQLDSVMLNPEACEKEVILNFEAKSLRDTREILQKVSLNLNLRLGCLAFRLIPQWHTALRVQSGSHPR